MSMPAGDLAVGATVTLTVTVLPQSAGSLTCTASASSDAVDPNFANNLGFKLVSVGFQAAIDVVNQLRFTANSLLYDPVRRLLWASIPATVDAPLGRSVVSIIQSVSSLLLGGYPITIDGANNLVLSSGGQIVDSSNLTLRASLGLSGRPCLDGPNQRTYLVNGNGLRAYDSTTGSATSTFTLPTTATGDWTQSLVRWGLDGFAILGNDGKIYIARWSATIPPGLADAWKAAQFSSLTVNHLGDFDGDGQITAFEYLFTTSPVQTSTNPVQTSLATIGAQRFIRLVFPRRGGLALAVYGYESSSNIAQWNPVTNPSETVLATQTVGGVTVDTVEALIPAASPDCG